MTSLGLEVGKLREHSYKSIDPQLRVTLSSEFGNRANQSSQNWMREFVKQNDFRLLVTQLGLG